MSFIGHALEDHHSAGPCRWSDTTETRRPNRKRNKKRQMEWKISNTQTRLYIVAAAVLVVGLGSATWIYLAAENGSDSTLIHDFENSKRYRHGLELVGGKMNVLADEFCRWFDGLWYGKSLAFTVGWITIFVASIFFLLAYRWPFVAESDAPGENNRVRDDNKP